MSRKRAAAPQGWPAESKSEQWVCFVRHGQASHNVNSANIMTRDNPLTPEGVKQCQAARKAWGREVFDSADLIISSPMTRALQTLYEISGRAKPDSHRTLVTPMCRERWSAPCDEGSPKSEMLKRLPWAKVCQGMTELPEIWWNAHHEDETVRVCEFLKFLLERSEKRIVVVSHGAFLGHIVGYHMDNVGHELMSVGAIKDVPARMKRAWVNINLGLDKAYEKASLRAIVSSPVECLQGIGPVAANALKMVRVDTVWDLADWKLARRAESFCVLAPLEEPGQNQSAHLNVNKAVTEDWWDYPLSHILLAPVDALQGWTKAHSALFRKLGIKTIEDLGNWKQFKRARAICALAEVETPSGSVKGA